MVRNKYSIYTRKVGTKTWIREPTRLLTNKRDAQQIVTHYKKVERKTPYKHKYEYKIKKWKK